jgi:hypothetical protein
MSQDDERKKGDRRQPSPNTGEMEKKDGNLR